MYIVAPSINPKTRRGFTLIELLFVIAMLGVLSTTGILFYQQRMQTQKIEKTVSQIEQWLQAGMAYYARNNRWPNITEIATYMPEGAADKNPWCDTTRNGGQPCFSVAQSPRDPLLFAVTATLLSTDTLTLSTIAKRLPFAEVSSSNQITAIVSVPEAKKATEDAILVRVGFRNLGEGQFEALTGSGSEGYSMAKIFIPPSEQPDCSRYGKGTDYKLEIYPIVRNWVMNKEDQPFPVFSKLSLRPIGLNTKKEYELRVCARLQSIWRSRAFTRPEPPNRVQSKAVAADSFDIRVWLFFVCKKEGTVSNYDSLVAVADDCGFNTGKTSESPLESKVESTTLPLSKVRF
jgi:prepilin-type N-terminal cleavage/methylation domain-containing protein